MSKRSYSLLTPTQGPTVQAEFTNDRERINSFVPVMCSFPNIRGNRNDSNVLAAIDSDVSCTAGPDHGPVYRSFCENALDKQVAYLADLPANHSRDNNATNGNETIRWLATSE